MTTITQQTCKAARAKIVALCEDTTSRHGVEWALAMHTARQFHEYATTKDIAHLFLDGIDAISKADADWIAEELFPSFDGEEDEQDYLEQIKEQEEWVMECVQSAKKGKQQ